MQEQGLKKEEVCAYSDNLMSFNLLTVQLYYTIGRDY